MTRWPVAKKFYTEKDIEDLFNSGTKSLKLNDNIQLTEMAYEKAQHLGFQLLTDQPDTPPSAPVRPYLSGQTVHASPVAAPVSPTAPQPKPDQPRVTALEQRIRAAVAAKMGNQVDSKLLDTIIHRVLKSTGLK
jgi:hypothetical protein